MWSDDEDAVAVPPRPLQQPARMPQLPAVAQAGQRVALVAQAGQQVAAAAHPGQRVPDWLLSSDSEEDEARPPAQRHARVPLQPAVAQARQPVAAVAQARQPVAAVAQARQPVAAAALAAAPRIAQQPALQLEAEAAPAAGAQPKPLSALAAHAEAVKQGKAEAEASQRRRLLLKDHSLLEQFWPEQPPSQEQGNEPSIEARRGRHAEGPEPAAGVGATAVVPPTSGPRAAAGAQSAGAQRTGAQRAGAQPTTAHPAAAQPENAQLQRAQLLEERPMRGPPRDEQFAASPLAIGTVGLSLNEALAAKRAEQIGQPAAARSGVELLVHKLTYGQQADSVESKKIPLTSRTVMSSSNDSQRVALDDVHKAQLGTEHASFSPPTLIALCLQAVRDEPRLHAAVASWNRRDGGHDKDLQKLFLVLDEHMDKYRQLRGRLLVPYTINRYLFDYQREGVRFLADIYTGRRHAPGEEIKGGILADEMGLGKTIQVIAFLAAVLGKSGTQRDKMAVDAMKNGLTRKGEGHEGCILLVVPSPVAQQWLTELSRWGWFAVAKLFGGAQGGAYERALSDAAEGRAEVAICSYDFLSTHAMSMGTDDDGKERWYNKDEWGKIKWRLVVFDEVHSVKNSDSNRSQCAKFLRAPCKIGLSGTPFSNRLQELWSIYNVVSPATFGPWIVFEDLFDRPIKAGQASGAGPSLISKYKLKLDALRCTLSRLMLRRKVIAANVMTTSVQDLMVLCPLTPQQEWAYLCALNLPDFRLTAMFVADRLLADRGPLAEPELPLEVPLRQYQRYGTQAAHGEFARSFGGPMWRLQHREWPADVHESANTRKKRRARHAAADKGTKARKTTARDEDEKTRKTTVCDEDEDEDENEDPRGGEDEGDCAGEGADGNTGPQADAAEEEAAPMWLPEHESDEEESDAGSVDAGKPGLNRKLAAGAVVPERRICGPHRERLYRTCGACSDGKLKCMNMPQIMLLSALANHLDLARARPLEKVQSRAARRKHRDELRRAKMLLPAQDSALMPAGLRGEDANDYCVVNRLDPFVRMAGQLALAQDHSQSGKLNVCMTLLKRWRNVHKCKVLLFSWSLTALRTLDALIRSELADVLLFSMDGSTPQTEREQQKADFMNAPGYCIFLISGGVGGTGLNLQQANKVIIFEPTFDPAMEQQVIGRAHRIGNQQDVKVYRLVSQGTVEEVRYLRQIKKTAVSNAVLDGTTERRLFAEGQLEGMAAFLDYSRVSLTERIKADYEASRARYAPRPDDATGDGAGEGAGAAPATAAEQFRQPQRALHEDQSADDSFRIVDAVEAAVPELQDVLSEQRKLAQARGGVNADADADFKAVATDATVEHGELLEVLHDEDVIGAHFDIKELVGHNETELAYEKDLLRAAIKLDMLN